MEIISRKDAMAAGLTYYFTGNPCPNGHTDQRFVSSYACKRCATEHHQRYRKTDNEFREREAVYKKKYYLENRDAALAYASKRWRTCSHVRLDDLMRKMINREAINARARELYATEEGKIKRQAVHKRYYDKNRDRRIASAKSAGAKRRGASGHFSQRDVMAKLKSQNGKCAWCKVALGKSFHVDHIIPIARGGTNWPKNLQCLCQSCNCRKGAMDPIDFARREGRLV